MLSATALRRITLSFAFALPSIFASQAVPPIPRLPATKAAAISTLTATAQ